MANTATFITSSSSSSSSSISILNHKFQNYSTLTRLVSGFHSFTSSIHFNNPKLSHCLVFVAPPSPSSFLVGRNSRARVPFHFAVVDEETVVLGDTNVENDFNSEDKVSNQDVNQKPRPCELYVCNLPRSCDIAELVEMFKPFGIVLAAEVSRNPETGISKGCGYVTMGSINSAKIAIAALDGSDVGGREMRVRFSVDLNLRKRSLENLHSSPKKNIIYESPYKAYIGNLAWDVKPGELRNLFNQFGTVVSAKILNDRRAGRSRVYGFLSFSSAEERNAAITLDGTEFHNRRLVVRESVERTES